MKTRVALLFAFAVCANVPTTSGQSGPQPAVPTSVSGTAQHWTISSMGPNDAQVVDQNSAAVNPMPLNPTGGAVQNAPNANCNNGSCGLGCGGYGYDPSCPTRYFSIFGGAAAFQDIDYSIDAADGSGGTLDLDASLDTDTGWAAGGAVGRSLGRHLRTEFEFAYRSASVVGGEAFLGGQSIGSTPLDGSVNMYSFMPNLVFDFRPNSRFNPYVGVGTGVVFQDLEVVESTVPLSVNVKDSSFAYQLIVGVSGCLSARTDLFVEYRFFGTDQFTVDVGTPIGSASFETDTNSNDILFGLRIKRW